MNKFDLSYSEIDTVRTIDPEIAAHNIALAYIQSLRNQKEENSDVDCNAIFSLSETYIEAYNYAYNYVSKQNEIINSAE